jgi:hypothetical protein
MSTTATNYFQNFRYVYDYSLGTGTIIKNLLNRAQLKNIDVISKTKIYTPYLIRDGEKPETLAESFYGSTVYFWIILFANDIKNVLEDWPRTLDVFDSYIIDKYGDLNSSKTTIHHYEDSEGNLVRTNSEYHDINPLILENQEVANPVYIYDYETSLNEQKRSINLIRPQYKNQLVKEFQKIFK